MEITENVGEVFVSKKCLGTFGHGLRASIPPFWFVCQSFVRVMTSRTGFTVDKIEAFISTTTNIEINQHVFFFFTRAR